MFRVGGLVPFSTTDWPGHLAAVVFAQGCGWRCGYCHNPHLQAVDGDQRHDFARVTGWLATRRGLLDGVVFSGGEPTAQSALPQALDAVGALGFAAALHTAGLYPRRLAGVLPQLAWIALDIKAPRLEYEAITGVPRSGVAAFASLAVVRASGVPFEVRTTVHPALLPAARLLRLARELADAGVRRWVLQPFRPTGCAEATLVRSASASPLHDDALLARLAGEGIEATVRG